MDHAAGWCHLRRQELRGAASLSLALCVRRAERAKPKKPVRLDLLQDGKPLDSSAGGVDVHSDPNGSYVEVSEPKMYYLVKNPAFGSHLLVLKTASDFILHSFTYGNNCQQDFEQK